MPKIFDLAFAVLKYFKNNKWRLFYVLLGLFFLAPIKFAQAGIFDWILKAIIGGIAYLLGMLVLLVAQAIVFVSAYLMLVVSDPGFVTKRFIEISFVKEGAQLSLSLAGIFIVIALISIGIGVALRLIEDAKDALIKFFFAIILLPFTHIIAGFFIDFSNVFMYTFLKTGASQGLVSGLNLLGAFTEGFKSMMNPDASFLDGFARLIATLLLLVVFAIYAAWTFFRFFLLFMTRYVALWMVIILGPLAFAMNALKQLSGKPYLKFFEKLSGYYTQWWKELIAWSFIGVNASLFLYLAGRTSASFMGSENNLFSTGKVGVDILLLDISFNFGELLSLLVPLTIPLIILDMGYNMAMEWGASGAGAVMGFANTVAQGVTMAATAGMGAAAGAGMKAFAGSKMGGGIAKGLQGFGAQTAAPAGSNFLTKAAYGVKNYVGRSWVGRGLGQAGTSLMQTAAETKDSQAKKVEKEYASINKATKGKGLAAINPRNNGEWEVLGVELSKSGQDWSKIPEARRKKLASLDDDSLEKILTASTNPYTLMKDPFIADRLAAIGKGGKPILKDAKAKAEGEVKLMTDLSPEAMEKAKQEASRRYTPGMTQAQKDEVLTKTQDDMVAQRLADFKAADFFDSKKFNQDINKPLRDMGFTKEQIAQINKARQDLVKNVRKAGIKDAVRAITKDNWDKIELDQLNSAEFISDVSTNIKDGEVFTKLAGRGGADWYKRGIDGSTDKRKRELANLLRVQDLPGNVVNTQSFLSSYLPYTKDKKAFTGLLESNGQDVINLILNDNPSTRVVDDARRNELLGWLSEDDIKGLTNEIFIDDNGKCKNNVFDAFAKAVKSPNQFSALVAKSQIDTKSQTDINDLKTKLNDSAWQTEIAMAGSDAPFKWTQTPYAVINDITSNIYEKDGRLVTGKNANEVLSANLKRLRQAAMAAQAQQARQNQQNTQNNGQNNP